MSQKLKIVLASDHAGYSLKSRIYSSLRLSQCEVTDVGSHSLGQSDFTEFANKLCQHMKDNDDVVYGIVVCGSGIGMSMAANRHKHIRCALCRSSDDAYSSRRHNNANVLALGERFTSKELAMDIVGRFINTKFIADEDDSYKKYQERMQMIS